MKRVPLVMFSLFLSFCFMSPAYPGLFDDMKKAVEDVTKSSDTSDEKQDEKAPAKKESTKKESAGEAKTKVYTNNIKAFGLSWDSTPKEAKAHIIAKGFPSVRSSNKTVYILSKSYYRVTGKELNWLDYSGKSKKDRREIKKRLDTTQKNIHSYGKSTTNIKGIYYLWSKKQGLLVCSVGVSSLEFGLKALKKYGKPTIGNTTDRNSPLTLVKYVYPIQGNVRVVLYGPKKREGLLLASNI